MSIRARWRVGVGPIFVYECLTSSRRWPGYAMRGGVSAAPLDHAAGDLEWKPSPGAIERDPRHGQARRMVLPRVRRHAVDRGHAIHSSDSPAFASSGLRARSDRRTHRGGAVSGQRPIEAAHGGKPVCGRVLADKASERRGSTRLRGS